VLRTDSLAYTDWRPNKKIMKPSLEQHAAKMRLRNLRTLQEIIWRRIARQVERGEISHGEASELKRLFWNQRSKDKAATEIRYCRSEESPTLFDSLASGEENAEQAGALADSEVQCSDEELERRLNQKFLDNGWDRTH
jgi:hypothetical protein